MSILPSRRDENFLGVGGNSVRPKHLKKCMKLNPFTTKGSPFEELNHLALDRVKSQVTLGGERVKGAFHHQGISL